MRRATLALLAGTLSGCAVGPDFHRPAAPAVGSYAQEPAAEGTDEPHFVTGGEIPQAWWSVFRSRHLDALVKEALARNPTLDAAKAALRQAREEAAAQGGSLFPQLQGAYTYSRNQNATGTLAPDLSSGVALFNLHTAQVNVSYLLDIWGGSRRQLEALEAQADQQRWRLEAARLTLTANVVAAAIQEASLRAQLVATLDIASAEREAARILRHQFELGSIAELDVMAQDAALAATEATLPPLRKQLQAQRHLLAALAGHYPGEESGEAFELADLTLPADIPVSLPSALVRQRPDVLAAEAQLHAATAGVGAALAQMLPQLTLSANLGDTSTLFRELTHEGNAFWSVGTSLSQTLFDGGTLLHHKRAADALMDQAGAQYREVVLSAFQNVADSLGALTLDAAAVSASLRAEQAAGSALSVTRHNVELGSMSYLALLNAQQVYQQAVLNLAQARASRYADTAALFVALGGGWWNTPPAT